MLFRNFSRDMRKMQEDGRCTSPNKIHDKATVGVFFED